MGDPASATAAFAFAGAGDSRITTITYDGNGNTVTETRPGGVNSYTWDAEDRLVAVETLTGLETYTHAADGLRRRKVTAAGTTQYVWDGQNLLAELDGAGSTTAHNTDFPGHWGGLSSRRTAGATRFLSHDLSANTRHETTATGTVAAAPAYTAFGTELAAPSTPAGFGGQLGYHRDERERLYVRARHYRPGRGRWMSRDPVGEDAGWAAMVYVRNNPLRFVDPTGLKEFDCDQYRTDARACRNIAYYLSHREHCDNLRLRCPQLYPAAAALALSGSAGRPILVATTVPDTDPFLYLTWATWRSGLTTSVAALLETGYDSLLGTLDIAAQGCFPVATQAANLLGVPKASEMLRQWIDPLRQMRGQPGYQGAYAAWNIAGLALGAAKGLGGPGKTPWRAAAPTGKGIYGIITPPKYGPLMEDANLYIALLDDTFIAKSAKYDKYARWGQWIGLDVRSSASIDDLKKALSVDTLFPRTHVLDSAIWPRPSSSSEHAWRNVMKAYVRDTGEDTLAKQYWMQGNPQSWYFGRSGRHELQHLSAMINGQGDAFFSNAAHELIVQLVFTPEVPTLGGCGIAAGVVV